MEGIWCGGFLYYADDIVLLGKVRPSYNAVEEYAMKWKL